MPKKAKSTQTLAPKEWTILALGVGIVVGLIMTAANVYLGLYAGMTISASIPAAVIAMGVFRAIKRKDSLLESNIVQTLASAGESLAAGVIFTVPAMILTGVWTEFKFWPTTLIAMLGGFLGVVFMVPLRRELILKNKELTYPEGVACASVLRAGTESLEAKPNSKSATGLKTLIQALVIGSVIKFLAAAMGILKGAAEWGTTIGARTLFFGSELSPALLSVGYLVNIRIAVLIFMGGAIGWWVVLPVLELPEMLGTHDPVELAYSLWSTQVRYFGVGAMIIGGIKSIISVRHGIGSSFKGLRGSTKTRKQATERTDQDMSLMSLGVLFIIAILALLGLYKSLIGTWGISILTTFIMIIATFIFVAVSSYIVGLVGSSNNPVSGMTISALLGTAALFLVFGFEGKSAILATLGVAAVVCCAACTAGDCSQDLKTGSIVGATPRYQQLAQLIGVLIPAFVIAPVLTLLHHAYGIGVGLKAPQATLFASLAEGLFGQGSIPVGLVIKGMILGIVFWCVDAYLEKRKTEFRLHLMPIAVGIYLPLSLSVPILLGGILRWAVERSRNKKNTAIEVHTDTGILLSSGLIAGEAIMGILVALLIYFKLDLKVFVPSEPIHTILSVLVFAGLIGFIYKKK